MASALVLKVGHYLADYINKSPGNADQVQASKQEKKKVHKAGVPLSGCYSVHGVTCLLFNLMMLIGRTALKCVPGKRLNAFCFLVIGGL